MEKMFCFDVRGQQIAVIKNMIERCDLHRIIVVARSAPSDVPFQIRLAEERESKDLLLKIIHESSVGLFASDLEGSSDVFKKVHMAQLNDALWVHIFCCHADGFIVITDEGEQFIARVFEFHEELHECMVVLRECEHADRNIVCKVINAVEEGNLPIETFHRHKFSIHNKETTETFGIAVRERNLVVVRKMLQLCDNSSVGRINSFTDFCSECASARTFQVKRKQRLRFAPMINAETLPAIAAAMTFQTIP